ncbi:MAG: ATP-dependent DNA helicase [Lachnospiraceae bacterium]
MEVRISVRNLVEFILRSGDIDNRRAGGADNAMQEGSRLHRVLQARMGGDYAAEVYLRFCFDTKDYRIIVDGRADGIFTDDAGITVIDEIKTTYKALFRVKEPNPVHLAQAKVYAAIYGLQNDKEIIRIRMTYCNVETEDVRYFFEEYTRDELQNWFQELLLQYKKWADYEFEWNLERQASIENLQFPFPYREGQRDLVSNVYRTIYHKRKLFIEAPTGVGKTISTVFPAVKAMGKNMGAKIFYLTAKTITRTVAEDTFQLLRNAGLSFKSVTITAKEKICFMENVECNPDACPYAKGHLDRINDAVYDLLTHESSFEREIIEEYARKHQVCPFEFCLDVSLFADGVICDYNYVFDPHVYLKRFFGEGNQEDYIFLVDEAHNLLDRGREMYSAELIKERFLEVKRGIAETIKGMKGPVPDKARIRDFGPKMERRLDKCNKEMLILKKECEEHTILTSISSLVQAVDRLHDIMNEYLEENDDNPARKDILEFYFEVSHFLLIYDLMDDGYVTYSELQEDGSFKVKLFCVDPANNLKECMERSRSTILFSATFLPIQYYKKLLGGEAEDYEVYAHSIFEPEKRALYICDDVTSKYARRNESEYYKIAGCIHNIVKNRHGNYMVFFPSHAFLMEVYECYQEYFCRGRCGVYYSGRIYE